MGKFDFDRIHAPELLRREENAAFLKSIGSHEQGKIDEAKDWGRVLAEKYIFRYNCGEKRFDILVPSAVSANGKECVRIFLSTLFENATKEAARKRMVVCEEEFLNGVFTLKRG